MNTYSTPEMLCRKFKAEDVITASGTQTSAETVKNIMKSDGVNNVKTTAWDEMTELF